MIERWTARILWFVVTKVCVYTLALYMWFVEINTALLVLLTMLRPAKVAVEMVQVELPAR